MSILLHSKQNEIARCDKKFVVVKAGRRGGKSTLAVEEVKGVAYMAQPYVQLVRPIENFPSQVVIKQDIQIAYFANTYRQAREIIWELMKKELAGFQFNNGRLEAKMTRPDGVQVTIALRSWDSVETTRGLSFDYIVFDEVAMYSNFWHLWHSVLAATLTDREGRAMFISTPRGFNHFYELYNNALKDPESWASFHFTSYDNPYVSQDEIETFKRQLPEDVFAQEYLADFKRKAGLVYKEFDRERHLFNDQIGIAVKDEDCYETISGVDFGYTNPTAVLSVKRDRYGRYIVYNEWYKTQRTEQEVVDYVHQQMFSRVFPDPENASAVALMQQKGVYVSEVKKGKGSVKGGIDKVRALMKQNKILIHTRCINLISELEGYSYKEVKEDGKDNDESPLKGNCHALDALRYAIMGTYDEPVNALDFVSYDNEGSGFGFTDTSPIPHTQF